MPTVVVTAKIEQEGPHNRIFADHGFQVAFPPADCDVFQEDQLIALLQDADASLAGSEPYTPRVISALPKLRVIARAGVGYDAVNLAACDQADIPVCITPGVNHHSVAEHQSFQFPRQLFDRRAESKLCGLCRDQRCKN